MKEKIIENREYQAIPGQILLDTGEALKNELGISENIKVDSLPEALEKVYQKGYNEGQQEFYENGYVEGREQGENEFWSMFTDNSTRKRYERAFFEATITTPLNPSYPIRPERANHMFAYASVGDILYSDDLDFSNAITMQSAFISSNVTRLKRIDCRNTGDHNWSPVANLFLSCHKLTEITEFYPPQKCNFSSMLSYCEELVTFNVCSEIMVDELNLRWSSKLSRDSIISIINNLSHNTSGLSVTLSKTAVNNAFTEEEWNALIVTRDNWNIILG